MKILLIIIDGLGDEPIPQLQDRTPLGAAETPNLDSLAKQGVCGQILPHFSGATPTSEESHLCLFGYDPKRYQVQRGLFTAKGAGLKLKKGDIALRGNLATVDQNLNVVDRRAGRIKKPGPFIEALQGIEIEEARFLIKSATEHRLGMIIRSSEHKLSPALTDGDPFYSKLQKRVQKIEPKDQSSEAAFTAKILNRFLEKAHQVLSAHPQNQKREQQGKLKVNYVLTRGASGVKSLPGFEQKYGLKSACIAGKLLYQQIGKLVGMDLIKVKGATGLPDTNLEGKVRAALKAVLDYDFVFLHIKAADSLAEDGDFKGKKAFIERIDKNLEPVPKLKNTLVVVTCDHSTCSLKKRHCGLPCPVLVREGGKDGVKSFSEKACQQGRLGVFNQKNLMKKLVSFL